MARITSKVTRNLLKVARKFSSHHLINFQAHIFMKVARYRQTLAHKSLFIARKSYKMARKFSSLLLITFRAHILMKVARYRQFPAH